MTYCCMSHDSQSVLTKMKYMFELTEKRPPYWGPVERNPHNSIHERKETLTEQLWFASGDCYVKRFSKLHNLKLPTRNKCFFSFFHWIRCCITRKIEHNLWGNIFGSCFLQHSCWWTRPHLPPSTRVKKTLMVLRSLTMPSNHVPPSLPSHSPISYRLLLWISHHLSLHCYIIYSS